MSSSPQHSTPSSSSRGTRRAPSSSGTLGRSRSSIREKNLSMDEGSALSDLNKKADRQLLEERKKEAEAMRIMEVKRMEEQEKFSDEENDSAMPIPSSYRTKYSMDDLDDKAGSPKPYSSRGKGRPSSSMDSGDRLERDRDSVDSGINNGLEAVKVWQEKFHEVEASYKESMMSCAQLYNDKTALVYQVETAKDRLEDYEQEMVELRAELQRTQSQVHHFRHSDEARASEVEGFKKQIEFRDEFLESHGLHLPTGDEEDQQLVVQRAEIASEEKEELLKEISRLKEEIASMKSSSLLGEHQPKDIVQVSTRMVSEYKMKVQMAEAENTRLEGTVSRLQGQVTRYRNQVKELEEREDTLMKEKRQQGKEIRNLQSESEDLKTEIDLLKRREQHRKRRDYSDT